MTPTPAQSDARPLFPSVGTGLQTVAAVGLLAIAAARCLVSEVPFRSAQFPDLGELSRVSFAVAILSVAALWALGGALAGTLRIRGAALGVLILAFAAWALASAWNASDRRSALDGWLEQVTLLLVGWLALQLFSEPRRWRLLLAVLAGALVLASAKAFWQVAVEIPERIRDFDLHRAERLAQFGAVEGSIEAQLFENRLRDPTPTGYFAALANLFASALLMLTAATAGLAADRIAAARARRRAGDASREPGQIDTVLLSGALLAAAALAGAVVLALTRSRGGILAGAAAFAAAVIVVPLRRRLAAHWRRWLLVVAVAFLAGVAAVVAYGLRFDRLPTKTMTFRWYYWTAAAEIVRERPLLGAGPANFDSAYLRHRRPAAEEAVKMPHNVLAHAPAQFGIPGGALYLAILAWMLAAAVRPRGPQPDEPPAPRGARTVWAALGAVLAAALFARLVLARTLIDANLAVLDALLPAMVLAAGLALGAWAAGLLGPDGAPRGGLARPILACGLGAFVLHNMVEFGLWAPATAMLFWLGAGACAAQGPGRSWRLTKWRWPVVLAALAAAVAAGAVLARPVCTRSLLTLQAREPDSPLPAAERFRLAEQAARSDPLDPLAAMDAAKLALEAAAADPARRAALVGRAVSWAREATRRDPLDFATHRLLSEVLFAAGDPAFLDALARAVELNPQDMRLRMDYAERLLNRGQKAQAADQLRRVMDTNDRQRRAIPDAMQQLQPNELARWRRLADRAGLEASSQ